MEIIKQNVGIDLSKDSFYATVTFLLKDQLIKHKSTRKFSNSSKGFEAFMEWVYTHCDKSKPLHFTMEATGVYYENLAWYLYDLDLTLHVLLPNKTKKFAESLSIKSKTDKLDSKILGQMGAERSLLRWALGSKIYRNLKTLSRERGQLVKERTRCKNQLHAEKHKAEPFSNTLTRYRNHIKYLDKQIKSVENDIKEIIRKDSFVAEKVKKVTTIPGISLTTVVTVIAETSGFANITSIKQLTSYAGYDIVIKESGKWSGKSKISKKGNSHIRQALYMPAISSIQHSKTYGTFYQRLNAQKQNGLISGTAVQRKLLGLIYTLWKNDTVYIDNYQDAEAA